MRFPFRRRKPPAPPELLAPRRGSEAEGWLRRADKAVHALGELGASLGSGPTADQLADVQLRAGGTLQDVRQTASQVALVDQAIARIPSPALTERRDRLRSQLAAGDQPELTSTRQQAIADVETQLAADQRLRATRTELLGRMEAAAVGLEGLVARAAEASALASTVAPGLAAHEIAELAGELDGLRAGLAETERLSRGALEGPPPAGELPAG